MLRGSQRVQEGRQAGAGGAAAAPGLVSITTTDTQGIEIDAIQARLARLRRAVKWASGCFQALQAGKPAMVTLTYRPNVEWQPEHITRFLKATREYLKRREYKLCYVWVSELQDRGAVHYHVLIWLPRGTTLPKPDQRGWWSHGSTRIEWARNPVAYLCKYASKLVQKGGGFPKGLRLHGSGGLPSVERLRKRHHMLPRWLRDETSPEHQLRRVPGGGWASPTTGEFYSSPWRIDFFLVRLGVGPLIYVSRTN